MSLGSRQQKGAGPSSPGHSRSEESWWIEQPSSVINMLQAIDTLRGFGNSLKYSEIADGQKLEEKPYFQPQVRSIPAIRDPRSRRLSVSIRKALCR